MIHPADRLANDLFLHIAKHTLARHMVNAKVVLTHEQALNMIETGIAMPGPIPPIPLPTSGVALATTGQFANIIAAISKFVSTNLGPDLQILITELPQILSLISFFASL